MMTDPIRQQQANDKTRLTDLAEYYDTHDTSAELAEAQFEPPSTGPEPMVTYALRLPKPVLDRLRTAAQARGEKVSVLMRRWLEERLASDPAADLDAVVEVADLMAFVAARSRPRAVSREGSTKGVEGGPAGET